MRASRCCGRSRVRAAAAGRPFVVPEDVKALASHVIAHRLMLTPEAELRGRTAADLVTEALNADPRSAGGRSLNVLTRLGWGIAATSLASYAAGAWLGYPEPAVLAVGGLAAVVAAVCGRSRGRA